MWTMVAFGLSIFFGCFAIWGLDQRILLDTQKMEKASRTALGWCWKATDGGKLFLHLVLPPEVEKPISYP